MESQFVFDNSAQNLVSNSCMFKGKPFVDIFQQKHIYIHQAYYTHVLNEKIFSTL